MEETIQAWLDQIYSITRHFNRPSHRLFPSVYGLYAHPSKQQMISPLTKVLTLMFYQISQSIPNGGSQSRVARGGLVVGFDCNSSYVAQMFCTKTEQIMPRFALNAGRNIGVIQSQQTTSSAIYIRQQCIQLHIDSPDIGNRPRTHRLFLIGYAQHCS